MYSDGWASVWRCLCAFAGFPSRAEFILLPLCSLCEWVWECVNESVSEWVFENEWVSVFCVCLLVVCVCVPYAFVNGTGFSSLLLLHHLHLVEYTIYALVHYSLHTYCLLRFVTFVCEKIFTCLIRSHMPLGRFIHIFPISFFLFLNFLPSVFCSPLHSLNRTHKDTAITIVCYVNGFWFLLGSHREIWFLCVCLASFGIQVLSIRTYSSYSPCFLPCCILQVLYIDFAMVSVSHSYSSDTFRFFFVIFSLPGLAFSISIEPKIRNTKFCAVSKTHRNNEH